MVLTALLVGQPSSATAALRAAPAPATARTVARAREYVDAAAEEVGTVREIADAAGVSVRTLQAAFRAQLGESPAAYVQRVRLTRAHDALREADPGDGTTVTEIALRFGFAHAGRFAAAYARRYGQPPSATLRG
jgi:transcriptional regulator GlxA family with amidase domain